MQSGCHDNGYDSTRVLQVKSELELCKRRRIASLNYPDTASAAMEDGPEIFQKCAPYAR